MQHQPSYGHWPTTKACTSQAAPEALYPTAKDDHPLPAPEKNEAINSCHIYPLSLAELKKKAYIYILVKKLLQPCKERKRGVR